MILLLSTSDTDLLSARSSGADYRLANPNRVTHDELAEMADAADVVVVRVLGGYRYFEEGWTCCGPARRRWSAWAGRWPRTRR